MASGSVKEDKIKTLKVEIRSILISAGKNGASVDELKMDFEDMNGYPLPTTELGFRDVKELILSMPDVVDVKKSFDGHVRLYGKSTEATQHMERLISKQRPGRVTRFGGTEQQQQSAEQRRIATERKRLIERRLIEIAARGNGFIAYNDLCRKYQATYGERFDPKVEFNCPPKTVFTTKFAKSFTVVGRGATGGFLIRLKDTVRTENLGDLSGPQNGVSAFSGPRFSANAKQSFGPRTSSYTGHQGYPSTNKSSFRGQSGGGIPGRGGYTAPRFAAAAANRVPAPPRFGGSWTENLAAATIRSNIPTPAPAPRPKPSVSQSPSPNSSFAPLSVTIATNSDSEQSRRVVTTPSSTVQERQQPPAPEPLAGASVELLKKQILDLLSNFPGGVEAAVFMDAYSIKFKKPFELGLEQLRLHCDDVCDLVWNESSRKYLVKPKPKNGPLSTMASVAAAVPAVSSQSQSRPQPQAQSVELQPLTLDELKQQFKRVLRAHPKGIAYYAFPNAYRAVTGRSLDLERYDLLSVSELVESMPDIFQKIKQRGEILILEASRHHDVVLSGKMTSADLKLLTDTSLTFDDFLDRLWITAMKSPDRTLFLHQMSSAYQNIFGKPLPIANLEKLCASDDLYNAVDRFDFLYEGCLTLVAVPEYEPADKSLMEFLADTNAALDTPQPPVTEYVTFGEQYANQSFPLVNVDATHRFEVYVAQVQSPGEFFVQLRSVFDEELQPLAHDMSAFYAGVSINLTIPAGDLQVGMPCACFYEEDGCWYRGLVEAVEGDLVTVYMVDFGTETSVHAGALCYLMRRFFALPAQAIECCLAFLSPPGETWPLEAGEVMTQFCGSLLLTAQICKTEDSVVHIHLSRILDDGNEKYLNDLLLDANLALYNEEEGGIAAGGSTGGADVDDESSSMQSFQTATDDEINLIDLSTPFSTPRAESETNYLLDMSFEQDIIGQLKEGGVDELEIIVMARVVLSRKRMDLIKKLTGENNTINDAVAEKLSWLEQQLHWLTERQNNMGHEEN